MNSNRLLGSLELFGKRMFAVAEGNESESIKQCPDWAVSDLMAHVGRVYGAVTSVEICEDQRSLEISRDRWRSCRLLVQLPASLSVL